MTPLFIDQDIISRIESARSLLAAHHRKLTARWPLLEGRTDEQSAAISAVVDAIVNLGDANVSIETANINLAKRYELRSTEAQTSSTINASGGAK